MNSTIRYAETHFKTGHHNTIAGMILVLVPISVLISRLAQRRGENAVVELPYYEVESISSKATLIGLLHRSYYTFQEGGRAEAGDTYVNAGSPGLGCFSDVIIRPKTDEQSARDDRIALLFLPSVLARIHNYRKSNWRSPSSGHEMVLNHLVQCCLTGGATLAQINLLERMIDYREHTMELALCVLEIMSMEVPKEPKSFDCALYLSQHLLSDRFRTFHGQICRARLIPLPQHGEGNCHPKPVIYITAACNESSVEEPALTVLLRETKKVLARRRRRCERR